MGEYCLFLNYYQRERFQHYYYLRSRVKTAIERSSTKYSGLMVKKQLFFRYFTKICRTSFSRTPLRGTSTPEFYNGRRLQRNMIMNHETKVFQETRSELVLIKTNVKAG